MRGLFRVPLPASRFRSPLPAHRSALERLRQRLCYSWMSEAFQVSVVLRDFTEAKNEGTAPVARFGRPQSTCVAANAAYSQ